MYNVSCDQADATQLGWSFDAETSSVRRNASGPETCLTSNSDNRQIWVAACDGSVAQQWSWAAAGPDAEGFAALAHRSHPAADLSVPGAQNSVGFARKGKGGSAFRIDPSTGQLVVRAQGSVNSALQPGVLPRTSCLAARAISPVAPGATFELWTKPLAAGKTAALVVNNGLAGANQSINLRQELGITGGVSVRDVWGHRDVGRVAAGGLWVTIALGTHASQLAVFDPHVDPHVPSDRAPKSLANDVSYTPGALKNDDGSAMALQTDDTRMLALSLK